MKARTEPAISRVKRFEQILAVLHHYNALHEMTPVKLRMILQDLGPTYVKLGQIMSSRQDLLPKEYTSELEKLRSNAAPMTFEEVSEQFEKAYGKKPNEVFASFNPVPLGSASMAQVHEAVTKDGQKVVVKVQRPGIYEQMEVDVEMMKKAGKLLSLNKVISSVVDIPTVINEFWQSAKEEMDFRHEAQNAIRFAKQNEGITYIHVPKIYDEYTTRDTLVMEEVFGVPIDDYSALLKEGYSRSEIAMKLGVNFMDQVVDKGFFHADPHSGNLKVQDGQIVWLDFGMMGELSAAEASMMKEALLAMAEKDNTKLTDCVLAIGVPPKNLDYTGFYSALEQFMNRYMALSFSEMDIAKMVAEVVEICHDYGIRLPKGITMLARSMVTIQGTLKDLDPNVNILKYVATEKTSVNDVDWNTQIRKLLTQGVQAFYASLKIPIAANNVLSQMQKGQFKMNLRLMDLENTVTQLDLMVDRMVVCILIAALLVGSSIVCTTKMKPQFLGIPLLGFAGFFTAFCLTLWLFWRMLFRRRKNGSLF